LYLKAKKDKNAIDEFNIALAFALGFRAQQGDEQIEYPEIAYTDLAYAYIDLGLYEEAIETFLSLHEI